MAPRVMEYYLDPAPGRRVMALRLMSRLFETVKDRDSSPDFQDATLPPVKVLARNDPDERVRVAAVRALGSWGGPAVRDTLREVARQDASQLVRYEAEVILLREGGSGHPERRQP